MANTTGNVKKGDPIKADTINAVINNSNMVAGAVGNVDLAGETMSFPDEPDGLPNSNNAKLIYAMANTDETFNIGEFACIKKVLYTDGDILNGNVNFSLVITKYEPDTTATDGTLEGKVVICQDFISNDTVGGVYEGGQVAISGITLARVKRQDSFIDMNNKTIYAYAAPEEDEQILNIGYGKAIGEVIDEEDIVDPTDAHWALIDLDSKPTQGPDTDAGIVMVKNMVDDGGGGYEDLTSSGQILGLDGSFFDPSSESDEFKRLPSFNGIAPEDGVHDDKFAITLEQCEGEKFCRAVTNGSAWCMVDVVDEDHDQVKIVDGDYEKLESTDDGYGKILDKESGTGLKRAYVRIPFKKAGTTPKTFKYGGSSAATDSPITETGQIRSIGGGWQFSFVSAYADANNGDQYDTYLNLDVDLSASLVGQGASQLVDFILFSAFVRQNRNLGSLKDTLRYLKIYGLSDHLDFTDGTVWATRPLGTYLPPVFIPATPYENWSSTAQILSVQSVMYRRLDLSVMGANPIKALRFSFDTTGWTTENCLIRTDDGSGFAICVPDWTAV